LQLLIKLEELKCGIDAVMKGTNEY